MSPPHHHPRHEPLVSSARPRPEAPPPAEGADDLGPATAESSARGRAGSPRDHMSSAPPPWRAYSRPACRQTETGGGRTVSAKADSHRREHPPAQASEVAVAGNPRWPHTKRLRVPSSEARRPATSAPRTRINEQMLCHSGAARRDGQPRSQAVPQLPGRKARQGCLDFLAASSRR
jgi:hypothetical protein